MISAREKAALIIGMVRAFETNNWPKHFSKDDKTKWKIRARWGEQMLTGGCFNPLDSWAVIHLADNELRNMEL